MLDEAAVATRLSGVFADIFDLPEISLRRDMTAQDMEDWDSLAHVRLIVAVENEFGISFTPNEIEGLDNVGRLIDLIKSKAS